MNRTWKIGTTGAGAAASLLAGILSFGGDSDRGKAKTPSAEPMSVVRRDLVGVDRAGSNRRGADTDLRGEGGAAVARAQRMAAVSVPDSTASWATFTGAAVGATEVAADDRAALTVTIPRRVTVVLPQYEGGRPPEATPPTYTPGTAPSVGRSDRQLIVDFGESGTFTPPSADPGESGTFTPPEVIVE